MKKLLPFAAAILAMASFTACKSDKKQAQQDTIEASKKQLEATEEYEKTKASDTSDYAVLKAGTKKMIADNEKRIAEFRVKLNDETAANRAKLNTRIDKLEAKNNELKASLDSFSDKTGEKWDAFKTRVKRSVDDIDKDIDNYKKEHNYK
jgi:protoporphyrinogen oxidase